MAQSNLPDGNESRKKRSFDQTGAETIGARDIREIVGTVSLVFVVAYFLVGLLVSVPPSPSRGFALTGNILFAAWLVSSACNKLAMGMGKKSYFLSVASIILWLGTYFAAGNAQSQPNDATLPLILLVPAFAIVFGYPVVDFANIFIPAGQAD